MSVVSAGNLRIAVTGSSGFVGQALTQQLQSLGHSVVRLVRSEPRQSDEVLWSPTSAFTFPTNLPPLDAVIHLAGANIADKRWTAHRRKVIRQSRVDATRYLAKAVMQLDKPPSTFVQASAIGWYGDRGDEVLNEQSPRGSGELSDLCADWESAGDMLDETETQRAILRVGMVVHPSGGAVAKMRPIFRLGLGGRLGHGRQWISWIARQDLVDLCIACCVDHRYRGVINAVTPTPVTNANFTAAMARWCQRPAWFPAPKPLLQAALGSMANEVLLASQRCLPQSLLDMKHLFQVKSIDLALRGNEANPSTQ